MLSWTALTWQIWMKMAFKTKYMESKFGLLLRGFKILRVIAENAH